MKFYHNPVTTLEDTTHNFEQLQTTGILDLSTVYQGISEPSASKINTLIQSAASTNSNNGITIRLPPGKFIMDQPIVVDQLYNITIEGSGSKYGGTQLQTTSTSDSIISARSSGGFKLRGCQLFASNPAYAGTLLNLNRHPSGPIDTGLFDIRDNAFYLPASLASTAYAITIKKAIAGTIAGNLFSGGLNHVRGLFVAGDYCNSHTIGPDNYFELAAADPIVGLGEGNAVICNTFEPLLNGNAGAYFQDSAQPAAGLAFVNNRCEDANSSGAWFWLAGSGISITGGLFSFGNTAILTTGDCTGMSVTGNQFEGSLVTAVDLSLGTHQNLVIAGNNYPVAMTTPMIGVGSVAGRSLLDLGTLWEVVGDVSFNGDTYHNGFIRNLNAAHESASATGGAAGALPALPQGYLTVKDAGGTSRKVPYYNV